MINHWSREVLTPLAISIGIIAAAVTVTLIILVASL